MSLDADEKSAAQSRPVELYEFASPSKTYRYASSEDAIVYGGNTYVAKPLLRSAMSASTVTDPPEFTVSAPYDLDFVVDQGYDMPLQGITLLVSLYQRVSAAAISIWYAKVTSIALAGNEAKILAPSVLDDALETLVPSLRFQNQCMHTLFDPRCTVSPLIGFTATTIAGTTASPRVLTVASVGGNVDGWYQGGELVDTLTGERRMIVSQVGTTIEIKDRFPGSLAPLVGRGINLFAGCGHTVRICRDKFNNVKNHTGFPYIPNENLFTGGLRGGI